MFLFFLRDLRVLRAFVLKNKRNEYRFASLQPNDDFDQYDQGEDGAAEVDPCLG